MSGKNRAFALAVATAALVGLSAPVASAASFSGPSGFNNDSILDVSGNQLPIQACNNDIPVNAGVLAGQVPLSDIAALLGLVNTGALTSTINRSCTQTPSQMITSTTTATSSDPTPTPTSTSGTSTSGTTSNSPMMGSKGSKGNNTSGFNNDSILKLSNNQVPVQACNNDIPVNAGVGAVQVPADGVTGALGLLNSGPLTSIVNRSCAQTPTQTNTSTTTATSSN
jgi:hypothetical protein